MRKSSQSVFGAYIHPFSDDKQANIWTIGHAVGVIGVKIRVTKDKDDKIENESVECGENANEDEGGGLLLMVAVSIKKERKLLSVSLISAAVRD